MESGSSGEEDLPVGEGERIVSEPAEILERVSDGFYALDDEWRIRYVNERAEEFLQRSEDELLGQSVWEAFPEARESPLWEQYHEAMETQESVTCDFYYEPLESWFEVNAYPSETGLSVYFRDVTEAKERERELLETQRRHRTLVENVPNGAVALFDEDLRFLVVGGDADDLDSIEADRLEGMTLFEGVDPEVAERVEPHYRAALDGERRTFVHTLDGQVRTVRTVPVRGEDGDVIAGLAISQNVTDQVERRRELEKRSRQQDVVANLGRMALENPPLDDLFDRATEAVAETLGNEYCKVLDLDPNGEELLLRSGVGWKPGYAGEATVPNDAGSQAGYTLRSAEPVVVEDLPAEDRFSGPDLLVEHDVRSGISTIIGPAANPWGILGTHDTERRSFDEYDVDFVQSVANILASAIERRETERELHAQRNRLAALNDLNSLAQQISESVVKESSREEIERLVCEELAASDSYVFAWIGEADESGGEVLSRAEAGVENYASKLSLRLDEEPGRSGPTAQALLTGETQVVQDVRENANYAGWREHARDHRYRSSAAIPIAFQGTQYGVLNVYSERPAAFGEEERTTLSRLGTIVGHALRSVERDRRLRESERRYRTLAENVPNGSVTLVDRDLRYVLAAGSNFDDLGVDAEAIEGSHVSELSYLSADVRERMREALEAALDGETTTVTLAYDGKVYEYRAVPVRDGEEIRAAMSLSQDVTERVRHEEELERERERLELMNRLIRHNLLNSLNVVEARLAFLEGEVEGDAAEHLRTARNRTESMVQLVETIRSLMTAIADRGELDLEPVSLNDVVERELTAAREMFPDAEFDAEMPRDVAVAANELLEEVVENLLVNAVQHNDKPTPEVTVAVAADEETATLTVADNGPGVAPDMEAKLFDKGAKGFDSPGTGFGLHLVREIVEAYGGDVSAENLTPTGTKFVVTLPRADGDASAS